MHHFPEKITKWIKNDNFGKNEKNDAPDSLKRAPNLGITIQMEASRDKM